MTKGLTRDGHVSILCHVASVRYPEFAAKLHRARKRTGKSQEFVADEIGTSRRHWIRWENGDHLPSHEYLERIAEALNDASLVEAGERPFRGKAA